MFERFSSSTRTTKLAGIIQGLTAQKALHIAVDNRTAVEGSEAIIARKCGRELNNRVRAFHHRRRRRPWSLIADGDLWQLFESVVATRGVQAQWFSWTKGHQTFTALDNNPSAIHHAFGNGVADLFAGVGAKTAC